MKEEPAAEAPGPGPMPGTLSALLRDLAADEVRSSDAGWDVALAAGQQVGRFRLLRELGRGGFGVVFEAEDTELRRKVALKAVRTGRRDDLRQERLLEEAEAAARLAHPNIVTLFDLGRSEHGPYLVLELLEGETLQTRIERSVVPPAEAVQIGIGVARGLAHAHARGVVHRDLKPGNVFLTRDGGVKILDFGLAHAFGLKRIDGGTPAYMAPEQWAGAPEDERTDVFALGVVLYRMLAGKLPFLHDDPREVKGPAPAPRLEVAGVPALGELVAAMLEKNPVDRPRDGGVVLRALELVGDLLRSAEAFAPRPGSVRLRPTAKGRRPAAALWVVTLGLVIAGFLAYRSGLRPGAGRPEGRLVIAVADVRNDTGDPELDALSGLLITSLEQSRRLRVLTRARMFELARRTGAGDAGRLDETLGREICRLAEAKALLTAAVHRIGDRYSLELRAVEPARDTYLFTLREGAGNKHELLEAIDRLSDAARRKLDEPDDEISSGRQPVEEFAGRSLDVYRRYAQARDDVRRFRFAEAAAQLAQALEADPTFALADLELVRIANTGLLLTPGDRAAHLSRARALDRRLPAKERRMVRAWSARAEGRVDDAVVELRGLAKDFPEEVEPALELGSVLLETGRFEEAGAMLERAHALEPTNEEAGFLMVQAFGLADQSERGLAAARRAREIAPGPRTAAVEAEALHWTGSFEEAMKAAEEARRAGEDQGLSLLVSAAMRAGDFATVERELARLLASDRVDDQVRGRISMAAAHTWRGRRREALALLRRPAGSRAYPAFKEMERVAILAGLRAPEELRGAANLLRRLDPSMTAKIAVDVAIAGEADVAASLARGLAPGSPVERLYRAVVGWRARRSGEALDELRGAAAAGSSDVSLVALLLGEAELEAGRVERAAEMLRRFHRFEAPSRWLAWARPRGELALARAELALGRKEAARPLVVRLERFWAGADPDFPALAELRALRERLGP